MTVALPNTFWTPESIFLLTGGRWLVEPKDLGESINGIGIDTRTIQPGQAFLAIVGEHFDGHDFVDKAVAAGARLIIIEREFITPVQGSVGVLLVDDARRALARLAIAYRDLLAGVGCRVVAVVGSNGKTTTRHLTHAVLSTQYQGTQSPKSFNNDIGVPLTVLGASLGDEFLVAEVGTNHPGEIDSLGRLLRPDMVVLTSIGREHMAFFHDLHGVAKEEASIFAHLAAGGRVFIQKQALEWVRRTPMAVQPKGPIQFGFDPDVPGEAPDHHGAYQSFCLTDGTRIDLPLVAPHDVSNAMGAAAVGLAMGVEPKRVKTALESVRPMPGRLEVMQYGQVTLINDTYNANPDSMDAALKVLMGFPVADGGRRVVILGDMLELGDLSEQAHLDVGEWLLQQVNSGEIGHVVLVGGLMRAAAKLLDDKADHYKAIGDDTLDRIAGCVRAGDVVLCKGSRSLAMERLLPVIKRKADTLS